MPCAIMRGRETARCLCSMRAHFHTPPEVANFSKKPFALYQLSAIVAITEVCYFWWFRVGSAVGGTCYGTLLVGLVTDEKAPCTGSTWGQALAEEMSFFFFFTRSRTIVSYKYVE